MRIAEIIEDINVACGKKYFAETVIIRDGKNMTKTNDTLLGEDIKECLDKNQDCYNLSNVKYNDIVDNEMYYITKHIGYYEKEKKSGMFILSITHVTDDFINKMFA